MADPDFKIKISTTADTSGAQAAASALQGLGKAAGETGKETRTLGDDLSSLGARQNATKDVIEGAEMAMKGNTAAVFGTAKAVKNLIEVFTQSTPMGRFVQLATIAAGVMVLLKEKLFGTADGAETAAQKFEHLTTAFSKISAVKSAGFVKELTAIKDEANAAANEINRVLTLRERLDKGNNAAARAAIDGNPNLTETEKVVARQKLEEQAVADARRTEDERLANNYELARREKEATAQQAAQRSKEFSDLKQKSLPPTTADLEGRQRELEIEKKKARDEISTAYLQSNRGAPTPSDIEKISRSQAKLAGINQEIDQNKAAIAISKSPESEKFREEQLKLLESLKAASEAATKAADDAEKKWQEISRTVGAPDASGNVGQPAEIGIIRGNEDRMRRSNSAKALRDAITADDAAGRNVPAALRVHLWGLENGSDQSSRSMTTISQPARMMVGGVDITDRINHSIDRDRSQGSENTHLASLLETSGKKGNENVSNLINIVKGVIEVQDDHAEHIKAIRR